MVKLATPGMSYSNSPVSVPATVDNRSASPVVAPRTVLWIYLPPLLILKVPLPVPETAIGVPLPAPLEFLRIPPLFRIMSSVADVLSPTLRPVAEVLPPGRSSVIEFPPLGVIVSLTIDVATAPVGKFTV
jgi:hypothetical protein